MLASLCKPALGCLGQNSPKWQLLFTGLFSELLKDSPFVTITLIHFAVDWLSNAAETQANKFKMHPESEFNQAT